MILVRSILLLGIVLSVLACNRQTITTGSDTTVSQTDPNRFDSKPLEPLPVNEPLAQDTVVDSESPKPPQDDFAVADDWMTPSKGSYLVAKIRRTGCYGTCPIYIGAIFSDGRTFYQGERFVENIGNFEGNVTKEQLDALITLGNQNHFYDLAPLYPTDGRFISDLPTKKVYLNNGTKQKTIVDRGNAPAELDVIEEALQTLLHSIEWKPIKN